MFSWIVNREPAAAGRNMRSSDAVTATPAADRSASPSSMTVTAAGSSAVPMRPNRTEHGKVRGSEPGDMELGPVRGAYASAETLKEAEKALHQSLLGGDETDKAVRRSTKWKAGHSHPNGKGSEDHVNGDDVINGSKSVAMSKDDPPEGPRTAFAAKGYISAWLVSPSPTAMFVFRVGCVLLFFGMHNLLQESIFAMDGFEFGWSIGLLETIGVVGGSFLERAHSGNVCKRVAPLRSYLMLSGLLGASSVLSNVALKYIQYPTKVIFRSCKLIPTMAIAVLWRKKYVSRWEFLAATAMCAGLVIFGKAESEVEPDFDPRGIMLVLLSVCADAFLPNAQEQVFSMGASRVEMTFYSNLLTVVGITFSTTANGNLAKFIPYAFSSVPAAAHLFGYAILSHVAIASHMVVVKEYGGVTAVLVGNTRKAMTIALSFIVFPKPFSYMYVLGGTLVLGGLAANVMIKERRKTVHQMKSEVNLPGLVDAEAKPGAFSSAIVHSLNRMDSSGSRSEGDLTKSGMSSTGDRVGPHHRRQISSDASVCVGDRRQDGVVAGAGKIGYNVKRFSPGRSRGLAGEEAETESLLGSSRGTGSMGV